MKLPVDVIWFSGLLLPSTSTASTSTASTRVKRGGLPHVLPLAILFSACRFLWLTTKGTRQELHILPGFAALICTLDEDLLCASPKTCMIGAVAGSSFSTLIDRIH